jgi:hypothetical protein
MALAVVRASVFDVDFLTSHGAFWIMRLMMRHFEGEGLFKESAFGTLI